MPEARKLSFDSLDSAIQDAEQLLSSGYETVGNWNLVQVCGHLENWLSYPMNGFPKMDLPADATSDPEAAEAGKVTLNNILSNGFPNGVPTLPDTIPLADSVSEKAALGRLREVVEQFNEFEGDIVASPFFGVMDKATTLSLQLRHFAHHLGFLIPNSKIE